MAACFHPRRAPGGKLICKNCGEPLYVAKDRSSGYAHVSAGGRRTPRNPPPKGSVPNSSEITLSRDVLSHVRRVAYETERSPDEVVNNILKKHFGISDNGFFRETVARRRQFIEQRARS